MRDKMRKKYQVECNKKIKELNKACEKDDLWQGRFIFYQKDCYWEKFEDGSGGILTSIIRAYDKKTGIYKDYRFDYAPFFRTINWHLSMDIANDFIVEVVDVWREEPGPRESVKDWTKIKVDLDKIMQPRYMFMYSGRICDA
jgi:hypothetical protein